jgi:hypothetical protein
VVERENRAAPGSARLATAALLLAAGAACSQESYRIDVFLGNDWLSERAQGVEVFLVADCEDLGATGGEPSGWSAAVRFGPDEPSERLGEVEPGAYGLYARVRDEDCAVIAAGCEPVTLEAGSGGTLEVTVDPVDGPDCEEGDRCESGHCEGPGADADADADVDCTDALCRDGVRDSCCPSSCTPTSDLDCCDVAPCSTTADGCCPPGCTVVSDLDCCEAADCEDHTADSCCPSSCRVSNDRDCCDAAACTFWNEDGCCPTRCTEDSDDDC